jgi:hypothetical protein
MEVCRVIGLSVRYGGLERRGEGGGKGLSIVGWMINKGRQLA